MTAQRTRVHCPTGWTPAGRHIASASQTNMVGAPESGHSCKFKAGYLLAMQSFLTSLAPILHQCLHVSSLHHIAGCAALRAYPEHHTKPRPGRLCCQGHKGIGCCAIIKMICCCAALKTLRAYNGDKLKAAAATAYCAGVSHGSTSTCKQA